MSEEELNDADKEKLANDLRMVLGVDVKFERLSKDDLVKLVRAIMNLSTLTQTAARTLRHNVEEKIMNKPLKELLRRPPTAPEIVGGSIPKDGPLGWGIIPAITKALKEPKPQEPENAQEQSPQ